MQEEAREADVQDVGCPLEDHRRQGAVLHVLRKQACCSQARQPQLRQLEHQQRLLRSRPGPPPLLLLLLFVVNRADALLAGRGAGTC